jgi:single-strand DNA-binding protein
MPSLNRVMLMGNLTRDPELRYTPKGSPVLDISLAINRQWKDDNGSKQEEVTFVDVTFWGKQAEVLAQYLHKGNPLYVEGRLQLESWDDKQTGQKRTRMKVQGESFQFLGNSSDRQERQEQAPRQEQGRTQSTAAGYAVARMNQQSRQPAFPQGGDNEPDEIPF